MKTFLVVLTECFFIIPENIQTFKLKDKKKKQKRLQERQTKKNSEPHDLDLIVKITFKKRIRILAGSDSQNSVKNINKGEINNAQQMQIMRK